MKHKTLLTTTILVLIACSLIMRDGLIFLVSLLMAGVIWGMICYFRTGVLKMTRWAKNHPHKAQGLIFLLQLLLMVLGLFVGNNINELGYAFSKSTAFIFFAIIVAGFVIVPFLPKRSNLVLPIELAKNRLAYLGIILSSFFIMVLFGNRVGDIYPDSPVTHALNKIDRAVFPQDNLDETDVHAPTPEAVAVAFAAYTSSTNETINPSKGNFKSSKEELKAARKAIKLEKKKARLMKLITKYRHAFNGMSAGVATLLIILLLIPACAGICLVFSGGGAGAVIGGIALLGLSIFGIFKIANRNKTKNAEST
ncbi:hypothetical protein MD537_09870 [Flavihumibacter sediminis]|nr:hypothetical protein [Flavihumibacter sediminis]